MFVSPSAEWDSQTIKTKCLHCWHTVTIFFSVLSWDFWKLLAHQILVEKHIYGLVLRNQSGKFPDLTPPIFLWEILQDIAFTNNFQVTVTISHFTDFYLIRTVKSVNEIDRVSWSWIREMRWNSVGIITAMLYLEKFYGI